MEGPPRNGSRSLPEPRNKIKNTIQPIPGPRLWMRGQRRQNGIGRVGGYDEQYGERSHAVECGEVPGSTGTSRTAFRRFWPSAVCNRRHIGTDAPNSPVRLQ